MTDANTGREIYMSPAAEAIWGRTIENLSVVRVDAERNLLLIRGAVPGAPGSQVIVRPSVKAAAQLKRKRIAPAKK